MRNKLVVIGDSITYGYGLDSINEAYPYLVQKELEFKKLQNLGICATTLSNDHRPNRVISERIHEVDDDADVVTLLGGINDFESSDKLGEYGDKTNKTVYGALDIIARKLKEKFKDKDTLIIFMLPTPMGNKRENSTTISHYCEGGYRLSDICEAIKKVALDYEIKVLDLYHLINVDENNIKKILPDGQHPNKLGHIRMASALSKFILENEKKEVRQ